MIVNHSFPPPVVGLGLPAPENLRVDIWDGEARAHWSRPTNAPPGLRYNVEMAKYVSISICFLLEMQSCLFFCIIQEHLWTLIPPHVFSAHRYTDEWNKVDYCTDITDTSCDLSSLIREYNIGYKVKVQLVVGVNSSAWIKKKFLPNTSRCGERSKTLTLWLVVFLSFIFTHHFPCRQTAASVLYFMAYIQLSDSLCSPKTHFA